MDKDEIVFSGAYKDFSLGLRYDVTGKEPREVARVLTSISQRIEPYSFKFAGINTKIIEDIADKVSGKGLAAAYGFLESNPPKELKSALQKAVQDPLLLSAAETCLINALLVKAGVKFKAASGETPALKSEPEKPEDVIGFQGKFDAWVAIKKLGLEKVHDYEVSAILAGVNHTLVNKAFDFSGTKKDDALVASVASGKRRSFGNIGMLLRELEGKLSGDDSDAYVVCKSLDTLGYKPYASPGMLTDAHPDIKPPKVKGRKPKA